MLWKNIEGYLTLPNGLMIQWGRVSRSSSGYASVFFTLPFPHTPTAFSTCAYSSNSHQTEKGNGYITDVTTTGMRVGTIDNYYSYWMAFGEV